MVQIVKTARGGITSEHGESVGRSRPHIGVDIGHGNSTNEDLLMVAPAGGVVTAAGWSGTYGNRVIITHADGTWSLIAHMDSLAVAKGDQVKQGQKIGVMGRTGGPWGSIAGWFVHGHQEYHLADGTAVNPLDYLTSTAGSGANLLEDDMPLNNDDVVKILNGEFDSGLRNADGSPRWMSIAGAFKSLLWYEDRIHGMAEKIPADVWAHPLVHPLAKVDGQPARVAAGELLRYEPAEHEATRRSVAAAVSKSGIDIDYDELVASLKGSGLDPQAIAVYSADEADRRERERLGK
ncbi:MULTISPECIES: M23 family metallopeptidase [unclassified Cryobacterium]|uniref:M23 family metallopeptidase n=1 Tax=unclassified Cryobacterium TaxID=2649013 RepID=UPI00106967CC|nr:MULTISPECIES: M23 family metallopeptidase [unclassified Cryobacterium]TFC59398.1 M23 family metallopeptidase [Cryobacterium sp. TMB3-1-2]TFC67194.1 M23 family metallopeptidase [Cryobacterium sp. TMB3-15]TFC73293.1 M23 family metallopeptidase [Cryobacterium sp. TMB3-10]TFD46181.1 M23 family metallopeptidase [Cryobacterium sp. TMB3-12]